MTVAGAEFYDSSGRLVFNTFAPPFIFLGAVDIGANIGTQQHSYAYNQYALAPDLNPTLELCAVQAPTGAVLFAITGDKRPSGSVLRADGYHSFYGSKASTGKFYYFGPRPTTSQISAGAEFYDESGHVIWDSSNRGLNMIAGITENVSLSIPSGKTYGIIMNRVGQMIGAQFNGASATGSRSYVRQYALTGYTNTSTAGIAQSNRDVIFATADSSDSPVIYTQGVGMVADLTGL